MDRPSMMLACRQTRLDCKMPPCTRLPSLPTTTVLRSPGCSSTSAPTSPNATTLQLPSPRHGTGTRPRSPFSSLARRSSPTYASSALIWNTPCSLWSRKSSPWKRTSSSSSIIVWLHLQIFWLCLLLYRTNFAFVDTKHR